MPQWATFAGFAIVVTAGLLLLSHASRAVIDERKADSDGFDDGDDGPRPDREETIVLPKSGVEVRVRDSSGVDGDGSSTGDDAHSPDPSEPTTAASTPTEPSATAAAAAEPTPELSTASLLANVVVSQGLFGVLLLVGAWYAEIPAWAFGVAGDALAPETLLLGVGLGLALYVANEAGATVGARFGLGDGERLRSALAPDSLPGWAALLFVVLPIIAGFEELLFRGALIGALAAGYDVSPWLLALGSSAAFGVGHGAQGRIGVLVTGALGFALAAAFVVTESLLVVVIAHYLVNALEFVVHEGLDVELT
ncbi:CPBP family intramembrane glutamic endopeptidase [Halobellus rufus]|uniref:CPBP family intramembrane glutamic endopeptidase n=1 Tax=Halobellus rufus TaxID=1448860 RepID=UPI0006787947|nr:CPBP family intramembrane glutamic endopeptidase [Halobellus rufus]